MEFEWDELKNDQNVLKHAIAFTLVARHFEGSYLEWPSNRNDEQRWIRIIEIEDTVVATVYTVREERIRIISARKARTNEKRAYRQIYPK